MKHEIALHHLRTLVGRPYLEAGDCWQLVRDAYDLRGIDLPSDYFGEAISLFRPVGEPEAWDLVAIRNHPFIPNHVGVMLDGVEFIHALENHGVAIGRIDRLPWQKRIVGFLRYQ